MNAFRFVLPCVLALALPAQAATLKIVEVAAPAVNCVFDKSCQLVVEDSLGPLILPGNIGPSRLQTRTFTGTAGAPGVGKTEYQYRVNLTDTVVAKKADCIRALKIDFGPVATLPYDPAKPPGQAFVVTAGGTGSVGLASATQSGRAVTFKFSAPICPGQSSLFFGLASDGAPAPTTAHATITLSRKPFATAARAPGTAPPATVPAK
jgi:hypothetical protein